MKKKIKFAVIILLIGGMIMSYTRVNWQNAPSTATPVNAENLNTMDKGIADAHSQLAETATSVTKYGASPSASWQVNRDAFQAANDYVHSLGGGKVLIPPGLFIVKGSYTRFAG